MNRQSHPGSEAEPYTLFIAYASADRERAIELKRLLAPEISAFVALIDLPGGAKWSREIPRQQRRALATVALVSPSLRIAHFLQEEIHAALEYFRRRPDRHQLFPVFLCPESEISLVDQYGFATSHRLDGVALGLEGVAAALRARVPELLAAAENAPPLDELVEPGIAAAALASFEKDYRACFTAATAHWDGPVGLGTTARRHSLRAPSLDNVYVPLRFGKAAQPAPFAKEVDPNVAGAPIAPNDITERVTSLVISGGPRSGKSTWLRWTFRKLLGIPDIFPIFVHLRRIAERARSGVLLEEQEWQAVLSDLIGEQLPGHDELVQYLLSEPRGPRPILLLDGWEELAQHADRFRQSLVAYLQLNPRTLAVVTTRAENLAAPFVVDGFEKLSLQPLSEDEVIAIADRLFALDHEPGNATELARDMRDALQNSASVRELATTPFLVALLVQVADRRRKLPPHRHELFAQVAGAALEAPLRGARDTQIPHWRPPNLQAVWSIVGVLAFRVQRHAFNSGGRTLGTASRYDFEQLLPPQWSVEQRGGFLRWLTDAVGFLVEQGHDLLSFSHLSLQEYFAALHHLDRKKGLVRLPFQALGLEGYSRQGNWWSTALIWAALLQDQRPHELRVSLDHLIARKDDGFWLAGAIFADGTGEEESFERWKRQLRSRLARANHRAMDTAEAFERSLDRFRRRAVEQELAGAARDVSWAIAGRVASFLERARLAPPQMPDLGSLAGRCLMLRPTAEPSREEVALGRIAIGALPLWPLRPIEAVLLRAWPSPRVRAGIRLQTIASLGVERDKLVSERTVLWETNRGGEPAIRAMHKAFAKEFDDFVNHMVAGFSHFSGEDLVLLDRSFDRQFADDYGAAFADDFVNGVLTQFAQFLLPYFVQHYATATGLKELGLGVLSRAWQSKSLRKEQLGRALLFEVIGKFGPSLVNRFLRNSFFQFGTWFDASSAAKIPDYFVSDYEEVFERLVGTHFGKYNLDDPLRWMVTGSQEQVWADSVGIGMRSGLNDSEDWLGDLRALELMPWRFGYRAQLARLDDPRVPWPHVRLIAAACRSTIGHSDAAARTRELIAEYRGDELWPALARHLIRENTASDVTLLEGLARNPQQRSGALEWALRYYVRGDILLPDSTEVTLDELCARAGQASLPYLV